MKILLSLLLLFTVSLQSKELDKKSAEFIKKEISSMLELFNKGDGKALLDKTHHSMHALLGGKDKFEKMMSQAIKQVMETGIKFESVKVGDPTQLYEAGDEEVCFVPKESILEMQGRRFKTVNFMIAVKNTKTGKWSYLDGSGLKQNKNLLWQLLPKLTKELTLPPNSMEELKSK